MLPSVFSGFPFVERFYSYTDLASTNEKACSFSTLPENGIFVFQADRQNQGKGRRGKAFFSDVEGGLWVSILTRIDDISKHFIHNRAISLAIILSLKQHFPKAPLNIKWPNDIYWGDRKICGILLETHTLEPQTLVIGIGLNINFHLDNFPHELHTIATSTLHETGKQISLTRLLRIIIEHYMEYKEADQFKMHDLYSTLLYRKGSRVSIDKFKGIFQAVGIDGHALINTPTGLQQVVSGTMRFLDK